MRDARFASPARLASAALIGVALAAAGCGGRASGIPRVVPGTPCAACGMEVRDPRYAAARMDGRSVRPYDSIECALRDLPAAHPQTGAASSASPVDVRSLYLSDFTTAALHRADSLAIVHARIPSPMGGGLAAFLDRAEAARVAAAREGSVVPIDSLLVASEGAR